jgi:hypothetical protein
LASLWQAKQLCGSCTTSTRVIFRSHPVRASVNAATAARIEIRLSTTIAVSSLD